TSGCTKCPLAAERCSRPIRPTRTGVCGRLMGVTSSSTRRRAGISTCIRSDSGLYEVSTGRRTVFTSNSADENWSLWAPDGRHVVFNSQKSGHLDLYQASSTESGGRKDEVLLADEAPKWPVSWSSDGKYILYVIDHPQTGNDIWVLPLSSGRPSERQKPFPYLHSQFAENWAAFSPDGHWVAYSSTESSGRPEVYVASFPTPDRRWKISSNGGSQARWRRDGRELFYVALDRTL